MPKGLRAAPSLILAGLLVAMGCTESGRIGGASPPTPDERDAAASPDANPAGAIDAGADGSNAAETPPDPSLSANEKKLVEMPANTWLKVPAGYISKCDDTFELPWHAVGGCGDLLKAWNSGVWDPTRRQMLLFGGGHANYAGNEVYAFSAKTFAWTQLTKPSLPPYSIDPLMDGTPVSRHTYDGLTWIGHRDRMLAWGGARSTDGNGTNVTWLFDPAAASWTHPTMANVPPSSYDSSTVYDPVTRAVFVKVTQGFYRIDLDKSTWALQHNLGFPPLWPRYPGGNPRGTLDSKRRLMWFVGGGLYMIYDIDMDKFVTDNWITTGGGDYDNAGAVPGYPDQRIKTGGGDVIGPPGPGLDYDPKADQLVAWVGGGPYVLDLVTKTWTRKASGADVPAKPDTQDGTLGRFRYLAEYNVFILVTSPNEVFFYKNTAGGK